MCYICVLNYKRMKNIQFIPLIILFFGVFSCTQKTKQQSVEEQQITSSQTKDWSVYNTDEYSIEFPNNWQMNNSNQPGVDFFIFSEKNLPEDRFVENVNLSTEKLPNKDYSLQEYVMYSIKMLNSNFRDIHYVQNRTFTLHNFTCQQLIYTASMQDLKLKFEQILFIYKEKAYILTLSCEEKEFANYQITGETILNSFRLK